MTHYQKGERVWFYLNYENDMKVIGIVEQDSGTTLTIRTNGNVPVTHTIHRDYVIGPCHISSDNDQTLMGLMWLCVGAIGYLVVVILLLRLMR